MNEHSLRVLEYAAVRTMVMERAASSLGRERASEMAPSTGPEQVTAWLQETDDAVRLLDTGGAPPFGGIRDVRAHLRGAALGATLTPAALLEVAGTLDGAHRLRSWLLTRREAAPALAVWAERLLDFRSCVMAIQEAIDDQALVRDEASPLLSRIRRELRTLRQRMNERLQALLRSPAVREMLQDPVVTSRDGRFCLPVKAEYRSQFGGLVHDQSASGATLFMEPTSVVELGNEIRQEEAREHHEVDRILRELSGLLGAQGDDLLWTLHALAEIDFIFARARLAQDQDASRPALNAEGSVELRRARHPLLTGEVVPIDVTLGDSFTVLVITGPNTGGKTVSLKTVGLLALMAQSGLFVPAADGARLPVFQGVWADIGDEQSLQQSLSTFSGHVRNIAAILADVDRTPPPVLVLLDEAGAGTDPSEGAALAKSILERLRAAGARVIATTHYGELKEYAYATEGVENASVEFDLETLRPTYRLLIGIPGSSNAFTIAARLGLDARVVEKARSLVGTDRAVLAEVIQKLTEDQRGAESDRSRTLLALREAEERRRQAEAELERIRTDRARILDRARREADDALRAARREIEGFRLELRRLEKEARSAAEGGPAAPALEPLRERLRTLSGGLERRTAASGPPPEPAGPPTDDVPPEPGDAVWIPALGQRGTLLSQSGGKATVQVGSLRTTVPAAGARRVVPEVGAAPPPSRPAPSPGGDLRLRARASISPELHLRGLRADQAVHRLEEYLDEALLAGISPLRIIHGKGTGVLRTAIREFLKEHPVVAGIRDAGEGEGGTGVTVVELRE